MTLNKKAMRDMNEHIVRSYRARTINKYLSNIRASIFVAV